MSESAELLVGVDLGTTDTKVVLTTADGTTIGSARRATTWVHTSSGRLETTGTALTGDVLATIYDALGAHRLRTGRPCRVLGVGIAGLAESGVVLDAHGAETSPVIAWFDERGATELQNLSTALRAEFPGRTGLRVHSQWTLAKLLWLRGAGVALGPHSRWMNVPEFVAWKLCGEQVSEPSLASRTGLIDQATGSPWDQALDLLGVGPRFLPDSMPAGHPAGRVARRTVADIAGTAGIARPADGSGDPGGAGGTAFAELDGAVVTVAGHDHPVAAVGAGAIGPQDLFDSCGTAEVLLRSVPRVLDDSERAALVDLGIDAGRHVLPGYTALIGGTRSGLVMRRVLSLIGADDPAHRDELDRRWQASSAGSDSLSFVDAAMHDNDVTIRLRDGATPDIAWAATLAHLGEQTTALLAGITSVVGEHRSAIAAGGWTRMRSVRESRSGSIPRLSFSPVQQPGTRGAALFAAVAALGGDTIAEHGRRFAATARCAEPNEPAGASTPSSGCDRETNAVQDQCEREHVR